MFAGYVGGVGENFGTGIAMDPAGHVYLSGYTNSTETSFPILLGPDLTWNGPLTDTFVVKLDDSPCVVPPLELSLLLATKSSAPGSDVIMQWQADPGANGYNIRYVSDKRDIFIAPESGQPTAKGVVGCSTPAPAATPSCTDAGAVPRSSPTALFYQVRAFCDRRVKDLEPQYSPRGRTICRPLLDSIPGSRRLAFASTPSQVSAILQP